jgi:hypothetical protein
MNKVSIAKRAHKALNTLAAISIAVIVIAILYVGFLHKTNRIKPSNFLEDIGDLSTDKSGSITWKQLSATQIAYQDKKSETLIIPQYSEKLMALNHQQVSIKGFMFPLEASNKQTHFLLSPYTSTCAFCLPAGANELIEVHPTDPTTVYGRSVTVKGQFELLTEQPDLAGGMLYRMNNASVE